MPPMIKTNEELLKKLKSKTIEVGTCWLWQGARDTNGYGSIGFRGTQIRVHRASAYLFLEFDLEDKTQQVNHKFTCQTNCWNPEHLYIGDKRDNAIDHILMEGKHYCPQGHPLDRVDNRGKRYCGTCSNINSRKQYEKRKQSKMSPLPE